MHADTELTFVMKNKPALKSSFTFFDKKYSRNIFN